MEKIQITKSLIEEEIEGFERKKQDALLEDNVNAAIYAESAIHALQWILEVSETVTVENPRH